MADETPKLTKEEKEKAEQEFIAKKDELAARELLGGKSDAGIQPPAPVEETPSEYVKRIMGGKY